MAAPHGDFAIPDGFPALLKDFAKEVLRAQVRSRATTGHPAAGNQAKHPKPQGRVR